MITYTIGHSTRSAEEFLKILKHYGIEIVVDVRHFPTSKKFPWFNKDELKKNLAKENIKYFWLEELGGFRKGGYFQYTKTEEFAQGIKKLLEISNQGKTAVMCAEILWFRCHRRYISEKLTKLGHKVIHIYDSKKAQEHKLRDERMKLKIFCDRPLFKKETSAKESGKNEL